MSSLLLALILAPQVPVQSLEPLEGVWADANGSPAFIGNGRIDYKVEDRYYTAMVGPVPDGTLLGSFLAGRDLFVALTCNNAASDGVSWAPSGADASYINAVEGKRVYVSVPHVGPNPATFARPAGEVRIVVTTVNGRGLPAVMNVATTTAGSHTPISTTYTKVMSMDSLSLSGTYSDKDLTIEGGGEDGRVGSFNGHLTYLGRKYSFAGKRIMGRGGFVLFDDSRLGKRGWGYIAWTPTSDRADSIQSKNSLVTDRVEVYFRMDDGSTAAGIHKLLKRTS